jgi:hypothetical protein
MTKTLHDLQIAKLRKALAGRKFVVCFGGGVDSTAMLVALHDAGLVPAIVSFADTGGEKPETYAHVKAMSTLIESWGFPPVSVVRHKTLESTSYSDLAGNCLDNETLPSLAFGMKSCSIKWKQAPQDNFLKGVKSGPNACAPHSLWVETQAAGERIVKLIGYDAGKADLRRSKNLKGSDADFDYIYPLQLLGWTRAECVKAIVESLGPEWVPVKSACYFCPASQKWELYWLAGNHPELFENALAIERNALTGRHSRFDAIEFGDSWENLVKNADRFPSSNTTVGLGRKFAWNQWAVVNDVVDGSFKVRLDRLEEFKAKAEALKGQDNALDGRSCGGGPVEVAVPLEMLKRAA